MAKQLWPGQDPIGKRIHIVELKSDDPWQTVVGVVGRVKQDSLDSDPRMAFYLSHTQFPSRAMTVALHSSSDPAGLVSSVRKELRTLDPDLPMYYVRTMRQHVDESLAAGASPCCSSACLPGRSRSGHHRHIRVNAYLVSQNTREIESVWRWAQRSATFSAWWFDTV